MSKHRRAVIYTRVSTQEQADNNTSLADQEALCRHKASQLEMPVAAHCSDPGVSGGEYEARPGLQAALSLIEAGGAEVLMVARLDRLSRDRLHQALIGHRVRGAGAKIVYCNMELDDSDESELQEGILGDFAVYERRMFRTRSMRGRKRLAEQGVMPVGFAPIGYVLASKRTVLQGIHQAADRGRYFVDADWVPVVERIFRECSAGGSLNGICTKLNADGVRSSRGKLWKPQMVVKVLRNPIYMGEARYGRSKMRKSGVRRKGTDEEQIIIPAPAIVTEQVWNACQRVLDTNQAIKSGRPARKYLLSGLLRCPRCGHTMRALAVCEGEKRKYLRYCCRRATPGMSQGGEVCHPEWLVGAKVEKAILTALWRLAGEPDHVRRIIDGDVSPGEDLQVKAKAADKTLAALVKEEAATIQAQIRGIQSGADPAVYDGLLRDIAARRVAAVAALREAQASADGATRAGANHIAIAEALASMKIFFAENDDVGKRRELLQSVLESCTPQADGTIKLVFRF